MANIQISEVELTLPLFNMRDDYIQLCKDFFFCRM